MYYAQYEDIPKFYTFKDIDKSKLDVAAIAKHIWDEDMSLSEIREHDPNYEKELRDGVFEKAMNEDGSYACAECGLESEYRIPFQIDHIIPMNKGGKTVPENLQILCRSCNGKKSDKL